jgi:hypothetical protein
MNNQKVQTVRKQLAEGTYDPYDWKLDQAVEALLDDLEENDDETRNRDSR